MLNSDQSEEPDAPQEDDHANKKTNKKVIYSTGIAIVAAILLILYFMMSANKPKHGKMSIKKGAKQVDYSSSTLHGGRDNNLLVKPFKRFTTLSSSRIINHGTAVVTTAKPGAIHVGLEKVILYKKTVVTQRSSRQHSPDVKARHDVVKAGNVLPNMSSVIRDTPKITSPKAVQPAKKEKYNSKKGLPSDNAEILTAKGWSVYYEQDGNVLLYRYFGKVTNKTIKFVNTAWLLVDNDMIVFANAINCTDKSIDTFAFIELDAGTFEIMNSKSRRISETGIRFKSIRDKGDTALYDKVCRRGS